MDLDRNGHFSGNVAFLTVSVLLSGIYLLSTVPVFRYRKTIFNNTIAFTLILNCVARAVLTFYICLYILADLSNCILYCTGIFVPASVLGAGYVVKCIKLLLQSERVYSNRVYKEHKAGDYDSSGSSSSSTADIYRPLMRVVVAEKDDNHHHHHNSDNDSKKHTKNITNENDNSNNDNNHDDKDENKTKYHHHQHHHHYKRERRNQNDKKREKNHHQQRREQLDSKFINNSKNHNHNGDSGNNSDNVNDKNDDSDSDNDNNNNSSNDNSSNPQNVEIYYRWLQKEVDLLNRYKSGRGRRFGRFMVQHQYWESPQYLVRIFFITLAIYLSVGILNAAFDTRIQHDVHSTCESPGTLYIGMILVMLMTVLFYGITLVNVHSMSKSLVIKRYMITSAIGWLLVLVCVVLLVFLTLFIDFTHFKAVVNTVIVISFFPAFYMETIYPIHNYFRWRRKKQRTLQLYNRITNLHDLCTLPLTSSDTNINSDDDNSDDDNDNLENYSNKSTITTIHKAIGKNNNVNGDKTTQERKKETIHRSPSKFNVLKRINGNVENDTSLHDELLIKEALQQFQMFLLSLEDTDEQDKINAGIQLRFIMSAYKYGIEKDLNLLLQGQDPCTYYQAYLDAYQNCDESDRDDLLNITSTTRDSTSNPSVSMWEEHNENENGSDNDDDDDDDEGTVVSRDQQHHRYYGQNHKETFPLLSSNHPNSNEKISNQKITRSLSVGHMLALWLLYLIREEDSEEIHYHSSPMERRPRLQRQRRFRHDDSNQHNQNRHTIRHNNNNNNNDIVNNDNDGDSDNYTHDNDEQQQSIVENKNPIGTLSKRHRNILKAWYFQDVTYETSPQDINYLCRVMQHLYCKTIYTLHTRYFEAFKNSIYFHHIVESLSRHTHTQT